MAGMITHDQIAFLFQCYDAMRMEASTLAPRFDFVPTIKESYGQSMSLEWTHNEAGKVLYLFMWGDGVSIDYVARWDKGSSTAGNADDFSTLRVLFRWLYNRDTPLITFLDRAKEGAKNE